MSRPHVSSLTRRPSLLQLRLSRGSADQSTIGTIPECGPDGGAETVTPNDQPPQGAAHSLFVFSRESPTRKWCTAIVRHPLFERFVLGVVLQCTAFLLVDDPTDPDSFRSHVVRGGLMVFTWLFCIEVALKVVAYGFVLDKGSYLRSGAWNKLDFIVAVSGLCDFFFSGAGEARSIRVLRLLRPLRAVPRMPKMRALVQTLVGSVGLLGDVFMITGFVIVFFAVVGLIYFSGSLRGRCVELSTEPETSLMDFPETSPMDFSTLAGMNITEASDSVSESLASLFSSLLSEDPPSYSSTYTYDDDRVCSLDLGSSGYHCAPGFVCEDVGNPDSGFTSFDNIGASLLVMFRMTSLDSWQQVSYGVQDGVSPTASVFFNVFIILVPFVLFNLTLAVIFNIFLEVLQQNQLPLPESRNSEKGKKSVLDSTCRGTSMFSLARAESASMARAFRATLRRRARAIVKHPLFDPLVMCLIAGNTIALALEHKGASKSFSSGLEMANLVCTMVFAGECVLKIAAAKSIADYLTPNENKFDFIVVAIGLVDISVSQYSLPGATALRVIRLLRVIKLARRWPAFVMIVRTLALSVPAISSLSALLLLFLFLYALWGVQLFAGTFPAVEDGGPRARFDRLLDAVLAVFQVLTSDSWSLILFNAMRYSSLPWAIVYFLSLVLLGNYIVLNLFLGILLSSFSEADASPDVAPSVANSDSNPNTDAWTVEETPKLVCKSTIPGEDARDGTTHAGRSFFIFAPESKFRKICSSVVQHRFCEPTVLLLIAASSISLALYSPKASDDQIRVFELFDEIFAIAFFTEAVLKAVSMGFILPHGTYFHILQWGESILAVLSTWMHRGKNDFRDERGIGREVEILNLTESGKLGEKQTCAQPLLCETVDSSVVHRCETDTTNMLESGLAPDDMIDLPRSAVYAMNTVECRNNCKSTDHTLGRGDYGCSCHAAPLSRPLDRVHVPFDSSAMSTRNHSPDCTKENISFTSPDSNSAAPQSPYQEQLLQRRTIPDQAAATCQPYLHSPWNKFDFTIVVVGCMQWVLPASMYHHFRPIRTLRALRPLRFVPRVPQIKVVVDTILATVPRLMKVSLIAVFLFFVFAVMGVQMWRGALDYCTNSSGEILYGISKNECEGENRLWQSPHYSFDHVGLGLITLFKVATLAGWSDIMWACVDATGEDEGRTLNANIFSSFFFVIFVIVGQFLTLNVCVGAVIHTFLRNKAEYDGIALLTPQQRDWMEVQRAMLGHRVVDVYPMPPESQRFRRSLYLIVTHRIFESFVHICIVLNIAVLGAAYDGQPSSWSHTLSVANTIILYIFIAEMLLKIAAFGVVPYLRSRWHVFDAFVITGSLLVQFFVSASHAPVVSLFRVLRVARLMRVRAIQRMLLTLWISVPTLVNVGALLLLLFFLYAVIGVHAFGNVKRTSVLGDHTNMESFGSALALLFRVTTLQGWPEIMDAYGIDTECDPDRPGDVIDPSMLCCSSEEPYENCGNNILSFMFFVSFVLLGVIVIVNLFVAVVLENFDTMFNTQSLTYEAQLEHFMRTWLLVDRAGSGSLSYRRLLILLRLLGPPLGINQHASHADLLRFVSELRLPVLDGHVSYNDTLWALVQRVYGTPLPDVVDMTQYLKKRRKERRRRKAKRRAASAPNDMSQSSPDTAQPSPSPAPRRRTILDRLHREKDKTNSGSPQERRSTGASDEDAEEGGHTLGEWHAAYILQRQRRLRRSQNRSAGDPTVAGTQAHSPPFASDAPQPEQNIPSRPLLVQESSTSSSPLPPPSFVREGLATPPRNRGTMAPVAPNARRTNSQRGSDVSDGSSSDNSCVSAGSLGPESTARQGDSVCYPEASTGVARLLQALRHHGAELPLGGPTTHRSEHLATHLDLSAGLTAHQLPVQVISPTAVRGIVDDAVNGIASCSDPGKADSLARSHAPQCTSPVPSRSSPTLSTSPAQARRPRLSSFGHFYPSVSEAQEGGARAAYRTDHRYSASYVLRRSAVWCSPGSEPALGDKSPDPAGDIVGGSPSEEGPELGGSEGSWGNGVSATSTAQCVSDTTQGRGPIRPHAGQEPRSGTLKVAPNIRSETRADDHDAYPMDPSGRTNESSNSGSPKKSQIRLSRMSKSALASVARSNHSFVSLSASPPKKSGVSTKK
eukprot:Rmarinus@m.21844